MFRDEALIEVTAGSGGDGMVSFHREKYVQKGGPDGGDGGRGGDIVLVASESVHSLLRVARAYRYVAKNGRPGGTNQRSGRSADNVRIEVPPGTQVFDAEHGNMLFDLDQPSSEVVIARGGKGGLGNQHFATSTSQVPTKAYPGKLGERRSLRLELKVIAEVGLLGLPNAGKSTFLSTVSAAQPKIASYPFTTLAPQVGMVSLPGFRSLLLADLPGLIEGASEGHGLGHAFLKHLERCSVLLQFVDVNPEAVDDPVEAFEVLDNELKRVSQDLHSRPRLVVGTKHFEDDGSADRLEVLNQAVQAAGHSPVVGISSVLGEGVQPLLEQLWKLVHPSDSIPV
jgi:GTP-binding protein